VKKHAKEEFDHANAYKVINKQVVWCGSGVGLIHSVEHAEDLVKDTMLVFQINSALAKTTHLE
jgi:hypothetical protein